MPTARVATRAGLASILALSVWAFGPVRAQPLQTVPSRVELGLVLRQLNTVGTFMMATAHPDDENNALLTLMAKGLGMRTILATATRGDGGQNEIGPELFDALAVLRTEELLAAHRLDGAEQYFTRAVDFGYSFSREETFARWGRDEIVGDYVRLIRMTRPDVVVAMSPEGEGGGQHHQASAILAREAYSAAADPSRYPEQLDEGLRPWQPSKFYFSEGFSFGRSRPAEDIGWTSVDLGGYDWLLGQTYDDLGMTARGMHLCQGMSPLMRFPGPPVARYRLAASALAGYRPENEASLLEGLDLSLPGLTRFIDGVAPDDLTSALSSLDRHARTALDAFARGDMPTVIESVTQGLVDVRALREAMGSFGLSQASLWEIDFRLEQKERQFVEALVHAHGLEVEMLADDGVVTPGQALALTAEVTNHGDRGLSLSAVHLRGFDEVSLSCPPATIAAGGVHRCDGEGIVPRDAAPSNIHWRHEPDAARYIFDPDVPFGAPFRPTPFVAEIALDLQSADVQISVPIQYRYVGDVFAGEKRTTLRVVPPLAIEVTPTIAIIPRASPSPRELRVTVANATRGEAAGEVSLELPAGWTATPAQQPVRLTREDESRTVRFMVAPGSAVSGDHSIRAVVRTAERDYDVGYQVVEYPHIGRRHLVYPARTTIKLLDVQMRPGVTVGYVEGVGDAVPAAIAQLGASVELIDTDTLAWGDLSRFDVIMTGVRAYERRGDLRANNGRLLRYAESGGTVIVQYNKFEFNDAQYGPYPATVSRQRVTDERAPVRVIAADHPVFRFPNSIDARTWADWVQERGLYFLGERDPRYVDLVELEDTFAWNPGVKRGALVEAAFGDGRWVYVGLGLWRQLPAGTPGAYALLANLLSLGPASEN